MFEFHWATLVLGGLVCFLLGAFLALPGGSASPYDD